MNPYTHFYLYAKGWYKKSDLLHDLQKIAGDWAGTNSASIENVLSILLDLTFDEILRSRNPKTHLFAFVQKIYSDNKPETVMSACMSILGVAHADGLALGKPDPKILPLS